MQAELIEKLQEYITFADTENLLTNRFFDASVKDSLTIPRPRIEYEFTGNTLIHNLRNIATCRSKTHIMYKKQVYTLQINAILTLFATTQVYVDTFMQTLLCTLPKGFNIHGNFVKIKAQTLTWQKDKANRIGDKKIEIFKNVEAMLFIQFEVMLTKEEALTLIQDFEIQAKIGDTYVEDKK